MKIGKKTSVFIIIFLFIVIVILGIFLFSNVIDYLSVYNKKIIEAKVIVADENFFGIEINNTALAFGAISHVGSSRKSMTISNEFNYLVKIKIHSEGNISKFLEVSENNFLLGPNESKNLTFTVKIPEGTPKGTYGGYVYILSTNPYIK